MSASPRSRWSVAAMIETDLYYTHKTPGRSFWVIDPNHRQVTHADLGLLAPCDAQFCFWLGKDGETRGEAHK